jgi:isoleucyl-tRNA synthetase
MNPAQVDLKQTVNLPHTDFSMKANLPLSEPKTLARWEAEDLYGQIRASRIGRPVYLLHDGPPYANGKIHLGTAFNKILKDFIVKTKTMAGFDSPYVPGWDCHGLPIEFKVDQELGSKKSKMSTSQIRTECRKYAQKWVDVQREDFKRLGVFGRWNDPYLTMTARYQATIAGAFVDFLDKGYVYKGLKPVHWCTYDRTALAEAEVEHEPHASPSLWVRFALATDPAHIDPALAGKRVYGLIWTTTPWTIPANMAICYHPSFEYSAVEVADDVYIVASDLLPVTAEKCGWSEYSVITTFPGAKVEHAVFRHPFLDRDSLGILGDHVTLEQGTGAVHTAPGHGNDDYVVGQRYKIATYCPVDAAGRYFRAEGASGDLPEVLIGKTVWEANPLVIEILKEHSALLGQELVDHSYPHCWRCHRPTIFRATEQWFIGMENNDLRQRALASIRQIKWMPAWGEERISNMIAVRPDWCISRQRVWGVPIVIFYCGKCREPLTDRHVLDGVVKLFAEHTADVWYDRTSAELIPAGTACHKCCCTEFTKEKDILDVWFDSGSSHLAVLREENGLSWPADLYIEGGDQYRGWFHSSLLVGVGLRGDAPYRECATNGWALDGNGRPLSKSLGNGVAPEEIIKQYGAELLRLWSASVEFNEDVRISPEILSQLTLAYRKLRNTFRYILGNISDFSHESDSVSGDELQEFDQWILFRAEDLVRKCRAFYDDFEFHKVYRAVYDFAAADLSNVYFDVLKDRLYTSAPKSAARRSAQTALYRLGYALVRLMAPVMTFTSEEVWPLLGEKGSVHTAYFPTPEELTREIPDSQRARSANWDKLMPVRDEVLKALEAARAEKFIGAPLEARVVISATGDLFQLLDQYRQELAGLFIVSQVELQQGGPETIDVKVAKAIGVKCERCWKYTEDVGSSPEFPSVCAFCASVLPEMLREG